MYKKVFAVITLLALFLMVLFFLLLPNEAKQSQTISKNILKSLNKTTPKTSKNNAEQSISAPSQLKKEVTSDNDTQPKLNRRHNQNQPISLHLKTLNQQLKEAYLQRDRNIYPYDNIFDDLSPKSGHLSIYSQRPEDLYLKHIKLAKKGNADSQYQVFTALHECTDVPDETKSADYIERMSTKGQVDVLLFAKLRRDATYCQKLFYIVNADDMTAQSNYWLTQAIENKSVLAVAHDLYQNPDKYSKTQALDILQNALKTNQKEALFYIQNYQTSAYHADKWQYINCHYQSHCDTVKLINHASIQQRYQPTQLNLLLSDAKHIISELDNDIYQLNTGSL